ncbi:MAG: hypothetical protein O2923_08350 [Verrucomicrobia bacterium]|nr:hypothetical protein [Verrucomicrobiota bacterium]MDA1085878.1 hypothetical protein [Verrucomicrobiota bacterium]
MITRIVSMLLLGVAFCRPMATYAAGFERFQVIKLYGYDKEFQYQVVSKDELRDLQNELRDEAKLFRKAVDAAKKEWREDESLTGSFPTSAVALRKLQFMGTPYKERGDAEDKIASYEERAYRAAERKAEREDEKMTRKYSGTQGQERRARDKERAREKESEAEAAREMFSRMLEEVKNPPAKNDAKKDDAKKDDAEE